MKHDTSFSRVIFITLFCLIVFPFAYQTISQYHSSALVPAKFEGMEIFSEYDFVKRQVNQFVVNNRNWPNSLDEAQYFSKEQLLKFDLSEPWALKAQVNQKSLYKEFRGKQIKFTFNPDTGLWQCDKSATNWPKSYLPSSCEGELSQMFSRISSRTWSLLVGTASFVIIILLAVYRHPLLKLIRKHNFSLHKINFYELKKLNLLALMTGHRKPLLKANNLTLGDWQKMQKNKHSSSPELITLLSRSLPVDGVKTENKNLFRFSLSDQFELNINQLLVVVIAEEDSSKIINHINQITDQLTPMLIWVNQPKANVELRSQLNRITKPCLIPSPQQMTQLAMFKSANATLITLAANHLPLNTISPYQGKGGITKTSHFFGRQAILDKLETQFQTNFLLVGGRQLGKTSLLKALFRKLNQQANNHCFYISLSDDRLLPRLAYHGGIKQYQQLDDLIEQIQQQHPGKKIRLLIDEADLFIQSEVKNNFKLLNQIRQSAEHQKCQFIIAGFWELYANAVIDYHSPLRNLADSITVGALETAPGHQLISQPMGLLGQKFTSAKLIDDIYQRTGGRANLINLICEYLIEQLTTHKQLINAELVEQAYLSDRVQDALQGWSNLSADDEACCLDRIIVYMTFIHQKIDLVTINHTLDHHALSFSPEQLKQSLQRLRLAHIISKFQNQYQFAVPLFAQQHDCDEAKVLIKQEIQHLKS